MTKRSVFFLAIALMASFGAGNVLAQASGNFSAAGTGAACAIGVGGNFNGGTAVTFFEADISTSNGNGVTLDIRPDLVTGLFTDTKISATTVSSATADIGIEVCVTVDGSGAGILPTNCAIYNQRFQQISSGLFSQLAQCTFTNLGTPCLTSADCPIPALDTCNLITHTCFGPNPLCNFELILSTLSANSFDFVVPVGNGKPHHVKATWSVIGTANNSVGGSTASCVGPGILTVTQYKVFNNSGALSFN